MNVSKVTLTYSFMLLLTVAFIWWIIISYIRQYYGHSFNLYSVGFFTISSITTLILGKYSKRSEISKASEIKSTTFEMEYKFIVKDDESVKNIDSLK